MKIDLNKTLALTFLVCPYLKKTFDGDSSTCAKVCMVALHCLLIYPLVFFLMDVIYSTLRWIVVGLYGQRPNINTLSENKPIENQAIPQQNLELELDVLESEAGLVQPRPFLPPSIGVTEEEPSEVILIPEAVPLVNNQEEPERQVRNEQQLGKALPDEHVEISPPLPSPSPIATPVARNQRLSNESELEVRNEQPLRRAQPDEHVEITLTPSPIASPARNQRLSNESELQARNEQPLRKAQPDEHVEIPPPSPIATPVTRNQRLSNESKLEARNEQPLRKAQPNEHVEITLTPSPIASPARNQRLSDAPQPQVRNQRLLSIAESDDYVAISPVTTVRNQRSDESARQTRPQQSLERVERAAGPTLCPALGTANRAEEDELDFDLVARPEENLRPAESRPLDNRWNRIHRYLFDPANPEKKKKYLYSIYAGKKGLTRDFPQWETEILQALQAEYHPLRKDFIYHAYNVLSATHEIGREQDSRRSYIFIVEHLRAALSFVPTANDSEMIRKTRALLYHLCYLKFSDVHMYPFLEDFVSKALHAPQEALDNYEIPNLSFETVADAIDEGNHRLRTVNPIYLQRGIAKDFKKAKGTIGIGGFDPIGFDSNTPWVHSIQKVRSAQGEKEILILRHGTPTRDVQVFDAAVNGLRNILPQSLRPYLPVSALAEIVPEFIGYVNAHPEKQILYVNHQAYNHHLQNEGPGEYARSRAIRGLENHHENFHFLALPFDGNLWKRSTLDGLHADELMNKLQHDLIHQTNGFGLPQKLPIDSLENDLRLILNQVHDLYFNRQELHRIEEKKAFIMLFYSELKDYVKDKLNINLMTSACKDNKDRGNASTLVDMAKNIVKLGQNNNPQALRELFFSALAPFIIKNEEIIEERLELALHVIRHLATLPEAQKQAIQQANERAHFKVLSQSVPKEEVSPSQMMGPESFLALLTHLRNTQEQRIVENPNFISTFQAKAWTRENLQEHIRNDLPHIDLRINGQRMTQFEQIQQVPLELLPFLTLEAAQLTSEDPAQYLNGNALGMNVLFPEPAQEVRHTQIDVTLQEDGQYDLQIKQDLIFGDHPITSNILLKKGRPAKIAWHFVRELIRPQAQEAI